MNRIHTAGGHYVILPILCILLSGVDVHGDNTQQE